jgi:hypothetical protein
MLSFEKRKPNGRKGKYAAAHALAGEGQSGRDSAGLSIILAKIIFFEAWGCIILARERA